MHLNAHIPKYLLTWQFGLSCLKQLVKFQLIQEKKNKKAKLVVFCVQQAEERRRDAAFIFFNCLIILVSTVP